jgi:hypothetical protein
MNAKIYRFKTFVWKWLRNLKEPKKPGIDVPDTVLGRLESVISPIAIALVYIVMLSTPIIAHATRLNGPEVGLVAGGIFGVLVAILLFGILWLIVLGVVRVGDYIIRGNECDDGDGWNDWMTEVFANAITRPISWIIAISASIPKLRRYRREVQSYIASRAKAESVLDDLDRPDAEELFSGIEDVTMLEGLLRK